jgi:hypothetical protein
VSFHENALMLNHTSLPGRRFWARKF